MSRFIAAGAFVALTSCATALTLNAANAAGARVQSVSEWDGAVAEYADLLLDAHDADGVWAKEDALDHDEEDQNDHEGAYDDEDEDDQDHDHEDDDEGTDDDDEDDEDEDEGDSHTNHTEDDDNDGDDDDHDDDDEEDGNGDVVGYVNDDDDVDAAAGAGVKVSAVRESAHDQVMLDELADSAEHAKKMWGNRKGAATKKGKPTKKKTTAAAKKTTRTKKTTKKTTVRRRITRRKKKTSKKSKMPQLTAAQRAKFIAAMKRAGKEHAKAADAHIKEMEKFGQLMSSMSAMTSPLLTLGDNMQFNNVLDMYGTQQVPGDKFSQKGPSQGDIDQMSAESGNKQLLGMLPMMMSGNKGESDPSSLIMAVSGY